MAVPKFFFGGSEVRPYMFSIENIDVSTETAPSRQPLAVSELTAAYGGLYWNSSTPSAWSPVEDPVDYRKVSTPDTTFAVLFAYDNRNPTMHPEYAITEISSVFSRFSNHVEAYTDAAATQRKFLDKLKEGVGYHNFFFYEFAHGNSKKIYLKDGQISVQQVYQALSDAHNRFVGIFDSCSSEVFIRGENATFAAPRLAAAQISADAPVESMAEALTEMFRTQYGEGRPRALKASAANPPMYQMWSTTQADNQAYYTPGVQTVFSDAFYGVTSRSSAKTYRYSKVWEEVKDAVETNSNYGGLRPSVPQRQKFGQDFDNVIAFF